MTAGLYPDIDFHLNFSLVDPEPLVLEELQGIDLTAIQIVYLYGIATRYDSLLVWLEEKHERRLVIFEDDLAALQAFLSVNQRVVQHPQIVLKYIARPREWDRVLEECAAIFPFAHLAIIALPSYRTSRFRSLRLALQRKTILWHSLLAESIHSHIFNQNLLANIARWPQSFVANRLKFPGIPAVICGAGPSLAQAKEALLANGDRALIIAGGSALSVLSHFGVRPHLGIALDPNPREYDCIKNCQYTDLPLIYCSRLFPKVFEHFQGPIGYLRSGSGGALEAFFEEKVGLKDPLIGPDLGREALSVTTMAIALAYAMGCNPIILAGVDLAYTDGRPYAEGVAAPLLPQEHLLFRKTPEGGRVATLVKWVMEQETISNYAKEHEDRLFFSATKGGLGFPSIPYRPLSAILEPFKPADLRVSLPRMEAPLCAPFTTLLESLNRCAALVDEILSGSFRRVILESDLQEEIAYGPLIEPALYGFVSGMRHAFVSLEELDTAKWEHVRECIRTNRETLSSCKERVCSEESGY